MGYDDDLAEPCVRGHVRHKVLQRVPAAEHVFPLSTGVARVGDVTILQTFVADVLGDTKVGLMFVCVGAALDWYLLRTFEVVKDGEDLLLLTIPPFHRLLRILLHEAVVTCGATLLAPHAVAFATYVRTLLAAELVSDFVTEPTSRHYLAGTLLPHIVGLEVVGSAGGTESDPGGPVFSGGVRPRHR